jgi:uncharacterized membrane protein
MLIAGILFLAAGFLAIRGQQVWGRTFFAAPLAVFGVQHVTQSNAIIQVVPAFMPFRMFWVFFVGIGLIAAAASLITGKYMRLAGLLLGCMWIGFVLLIHIPGVIAQPNRFQAALVARDLGFGLAAWTLVGNPRLTTACRIGLAVIYLFYGVEHLLHPEFAPGVPLQTPQPGFIPIHPLWGYITGTVLLATGTALLLNWHARTAATVLGVVVALMVLGINVPGLIAAPHPFSATQEIDVVFDNLLFAGGAFLLATSCTLEEPQHDRQRRVASLETDDHIASHA